VKRQKNDAADAEAIAEAGRTRSKTGKANMRGYPPAAADAWHRLAMAGPRTPGRIPLVV
jgi:hypothetical protein